jgi:D-alanyl-lipoteichoic acid acyltransferase DltB (MBOAT superfamily)
MLFNSPEYILIFLPVVTLVYFLLNYLHLKTLSKSFLAVSSLYFYSYWKLDYLALIVISMLVNYSLGGFLGRTHFDHRGLPSRKFVLFAGVIFNAFLLGGFKYTDFIISIINSFLNKGELELTHILLPLGISFFTFQQIAYLVDSYRYETREYDFLSYVLFVSFFPQLIAGPIVHHKEMMPQFKLTHHNVLNSENIAMGLFIFSVGLFKKSVIADSLARIANPVFKGVGNPGFIDAWLGTLSYTMIFRVIQIWLSGPACYSI